MDDNPNGGKGSIKQDASRTGVRNAWLLKLSASILFLILLGGIVTIVHGMLSGWFWKYWNSIEEAQASIIGNLLWVYAAAFAAVFTPLIFRGQVSEVQEQLETLKTELKDLSSSTRDHFSFAHAQLLRSIGYDAKFTSEQESEAPEYYASIKAETADICRFILRESALTKPQRRKFKGKQAGKSRYTQLLFDYGLIEQKQQVALGELDDIVSRDASDATAMEMNKVATHFTEIKSYAEKWYSS